MKIPIQRSPSLSLFALVNWINSQLSSLLVEELSSLLASEKQCRLPPTYGVERSDNSLADSASNGSLSRPLLRNAAIAVTRQSTSSLPAPLISSVVVVAVVVRLLGPSRLIPKDWGKGYTFAAIDWLCLGMEKSLCPSPPSLDETFEVNWKFLITSYSSSFCLIWLGLRSHRRHPRYFSHSSSFFSLITHLRANETCTLKIPIQRSPSLSLFALVNWINSQLSSLLVEELSSLLASEKQCRLPPTYGVERSDNSLADSASNGSLSRPLLRNAAIAVTGQSASSLPAPLVSSVVVVAVVVRLLGQCRLIPKDWGKGYTFAAIDWLCLGMEKSLCPSPPSLDETFEVNWKFLITSYSSSFCLIWLGLRR
ncbi:hypothetical protein AAHA92_12533 [Salvia divinorum]|uniref:Uncharacterized protein n=1 Tax=Salvia divinorum TaxID=28513 RepID=A0ABD1HNX5_SALDI